MTDSGKVIKARNSFADVEVRCLTACHSCSAKILCIGQGQATGLLTVKNPLNAQSGDTVLLEIPDPMYSKSLILVFGTLLLAVLSGLIGGHVLSPLLPLSSPAASILGLFIGLLISGLWLFRYFRKKNNDKLLPVITKIIDNGGPHG